MGIAARPKQPQAPAGRHRWWSRRSGAEQPPCLAPRGVGPIWVGAASNIPLLRCWDRTRRGFTKRHCPRERAGWGRTRVGTGWFLSSPTPAGAAPRGNSALRRWRGTGGPPMASGAETPRVAPGGSGEGRPRCCTIVTQKSEAALDDTYAAGTIRPPLMLPTPKPMRSSGCERPALSRGTLRPAGVSLGGLDACGAGILQGLLTLGHAQAGYFLEQIGTWPPTVGGTVRIAAKLTGRTVRHRSLRRVTKLRKQPFGSLLPPRTLYPAL